MTIYLNLGAESVRKLTLLQANLSEKIEPYESDGRHLDSSHLRKAVQGLSNLMLQHNNGSVESSKKGFRNKDSARTLLYHLLCAVEEDHHAHFSHSISEIKKAAIEVATQQGQGLEYFADVVEEIKAKATALKIPLAPGHAAAR